MGNFSRDTFDRLNRYVGVRLQQGVPLVDADWNEQEDIRKYELQAFLKWFVGNGVPQGNDGFEILSASGTPNDFVIRGGDGTAEGAGRCLVEGMDVLNTANLRFTHQPLMKTPALADQWGVDPIAPLTTPRTARKDTVYLDVWEREVDSDEDDALVNPAIGLETCMRIKREWAVRVAEGSLYPPNPTGGHAFYPIARLTRPAGKQTITAAQITDLRSTGIRLSNLSDEIRDARGMKANIGNRLDESLTKGGQLRQQVVGNDQVRADAAIAEAKIEFSSGGHNHSGGVNGKPIDTEGLANGAVTRKKLGIDLVNSGSVMDLMPEDSVMQLVEANVDPLDGVKKLYMQSVAITNVTESGDAQISSELVYTSNQSRDAYDVHIRFTNIRNGSANEKADLMWHVYTFAED
ncbi:DUF6519 domain-containing protein [Desulfoluna spongiiphila]|uniref:Uncharacterized protein n=1 Tax=Desulfoluna spongiiphila TaxID=419481 RepID=A0A1G5J386_9BACT|nr:DUF6519 domain-containing protein [Desulfoluna spongiiphila]SCY82420.1 hypothetical protein SAMN05216233_12429 [Desulfoluna spongiiphila]